MYIDGKMLGVTKYSFQICFRHSACTMTQEQLCNSHVAGMAGILSERSFDKDLACEMEIEGFSNTGVLLL